MFRYRHFRYIWKLLNFDGWHPSHGFKGDLITESCLPTLSCPDPHLWLVFRTAVQVCARRNHREERNPWHCQVGCVFSGNLCFHVSPFHKDWHTLRLVPDLSWATGNSSTEKYCTFITLKGDNIFVPRRSTWDDMKCYEIVIRMYIVVLFVGLFL